MDRLFRRTISSLLAAVAALGLVACAAPTPYGPAPGAVGDRGHGYWEQALEDDRLRVTFSGNSDTSRETVESYLLYRAAEITLERGGDHFVVADRATEKSTTYHTTYDFDGPFGIGFGPDFGFGYGRWPYGFRSAYRGYPFAGYGNATSWQVNRYIAHADIVLGRGPKPDRPEAYDARAVIARLASGIVRSRP
ncbi:MAG: hypothetical protein COW30_15840 [Rhodospirillales bacterium CG15_BIG_FIL_POST_REV_8_21_14_020_66_15]|nr:MAG: hypothetical protein COW30_15840 [Rhodospirillales bacterium CG15_BIG_FIL_POST_REV_8_21_14_020_66_15]